MRTKAKRDGNERAIIDALQAAGCSVQQLNIPDAPDLLVGHLGENYLFEVKDGKKQPRENQQAWHEAWRGQVATIHTIEDALRVIGRIR